MASSEPGVLGCIDAASISVEVHQDGHHHRRGTAERIELAGVEARVGDPEHGTRGQQRHLLAGKGDLLGGVLLPPFVERFGGHVVVVEHEGLVATKEELGDGRGGAELVEQDVTGLGVLRIPLEVGGLVLKLIMGGFDVDV